MALYLLKDSRPPTHEWRSTRFRLAPRTCNATSWGARVVSLTEAMENNTTRKSITAVLHGDVHHTVHARVVDPDHGGCAGDVLTRLPRRGGGAHDHAVVEPHHPVVAVRHRAHLIRETRVDSNYFNLMNGKHAEFVYFAALAPGGTEQRCSKADNPRNPARLRKCFTARTFFWSTFCSAVGTKG